MSTTEERTINNEKVAERLKTLRLGRKLTQGMLAEKFICNDSTISKLESGKSGISLDFLQEYSNLFQVSADYILFGSHMQQEYSKEDIARTVETETARFAELLTKKIYDL